MNETNAAPKLYGFAALSPAAKMLVINQFFIAFGFSVVLPFLAIYLREEVGLAPALIGLIIGMRMFASQGMALIGGSLSDRVGPRPMIILGCSMRVVAFALFAASTSVPAIILGTFLSGLATAFFSPAIRTYLMAESVGRRAEAFGVYTVAINVGTLIGPVIGGALLIFNFRVVSAAGSVLFALLTISQLFFLPIRKMEKPAGTMWNNWWEVLSNRRFHVFTLAGALYSLVAAQMAFAMALEAERVTGRGDSVTAVFMIAALCTLALQGRVNRWCRTLLTSGQAVALGLALAGFSWIPLMIAAPLTATHEGVMDVAPALLAMTPVLLGAMTLAIGGIIALPFTMELIPIVGSERMVGTYYGYYSLVSGVLTAVGSTAIGASMSLSSASTRWIPFAILLTIGVTGAALMLAMHKRGALEPIPD